VVEHALKREAPLGDTMARLTVLGTQNFAGDPETVTKLVETLRAELPTKVLGFTVKGNPQHVFYLIEAIGGTPAPAVRHLLEELVTRFKDTEIGKAAARAMSELGTKPLAVAEHQRSVSLFGDLELFGLPKLLQTLSESKASGLLTIKTLDNELAGVVVFHEGGMLDAQAGRIRGESAVYQLFERPVPGTFTFHAKKDPAPDQQGKKPMAVLPIIIEAMQRFDALAEVRFLVPDEVRFKATGSRPTPHPDEQDGTFLRALWERVGSGATAVGCEQDMASDAFRVRRLLHHWVNQGALQPV
jgi:hypothetical protein